MGIIKLTKNEYKNNQREISRLLGDAIATAATQVGSMRGVLTGDKRELVTSTNTDKAA